MIKILPSDKVIQFENNVFSTNYCKYLQQNDNLPFKIVSNLDDSDFIVHFENIKNFNNIEKLNKFNKKIIFILNADDTDKYITSKKDIYFVTNIKKDCKDICQYPIFYIPSVNDYRIRTRKNNWIQNLDDLNDLMNKKKYIFSFIGSLTTDINRKKLLIYKDYKEDILVDTWEWWKHKDGHGDRKVFYIDILEQSIFTLCPYGNGPSSIRFIDSIISGSIPILIEDYTFPFNEDYNFAIKIKYDQINKIEEIVRDIISNKDDLKNRFHLMNNFIKKYWDKKLYEDNIPDKNNLIKVCPYLNIPRTFLYNCICKIKP